MRIPAVASVDDGCAAGRLKDNHGGARAVVGVDEGDAHALHQLRRIQLHHAQPLPRHLHAGACSQSSVTNSLRISCYFRRPLQRCSIEAFL